VEVTPTGEVIVRADRTKVVFILLGGLALTAVAFWLGSLPAEIAHRPVWYLRAIAVAWVAFFAFVTPLWVQRFLQRGPVLVIDDKGIVDRMGYLSNGRIYWSDVRGVRLIKMRGQKLIVIDVHNPQQFTDHGDVVQRWVKAINQRMAGSPVTLAMAGLDSSAEQVLATIERFFDRAAGSRVSPPV
jgi:hypothetical protein